MANLLSEHFSLSYPEDTLAETTLPDDDGPVDGIASVAYDLLEYSSSGSTVISGALSLELGFAEGAVEMLVDHTAPMFWSFGVRTQARVLCRDDQLLRPLRWSVDFSSLSGTDVVDDTSGSAKGWVHGSAMHHDSMGPSSVALPEGTDLTTNWGLLAALPRLTAAGTTRTTFTMLEELHLVRPDQVLEHFAELDVATAGGTRRLLGWRHWGTGTPPVHYWTTATGWPVVVAGIRRVLVATSISTGPRPAGA